jgi:pimeloyl-ACP methyl ester carboxylesterase
VRVLVFHDPRDEKVPFRDGEEVVRTWPNAKLVATSGLGHHRILSNPKVIADAVRFVSGPSGVPAVERQPCRARLGAAFAS